MQPTTRSNKLVPAAIALLLLVAHAATGAISGPTPAQVAKSEGSFLMRPGVIVVESDAMAYVMNNQRSIDAIDLARGELAWRSSAGARPLMLFGDYLVAQADTDGLGRELEIVFLDTRNDGRARHTARIELPEGAEVRIDEGLGKIFDLHASLFQGDVYLTWSYTERRISGIPTPLDNDVLEATGALRFDLASGLLEHVDNADLPAVPSFRPDLAAAERLPGVEGVQFRSSDDRYALVGDRVADDREWDRYRWTIYNKSSAQVVGTARAPFSHARYFVAGTSLVYESHPFVRRLGDELVEEPLKLLAIDLGNGNELWDWPIRDTKYRGPYPP